MATETMSKNGRRGNLFVSRDAWLAAADTRPIVEMDAPELGEGAVVLLRAMSQRDRDAWDLRLFGDIPMEDIDAALRERRKGLRLRDVREHEKAELLTRCIVDERGEPVFGADDVAFVEGLSAALVQRLYTRAAELCGLQEPAQDAAGKVSSSGPPSDGSPSA